MKSPSQEELNELESQYLKNLGDETKFHYSIREAIREFEIPLTNTFVMLHASPIDHKEENKEFNGQEQKQNKIGRISKNENPKISLPVSILLQEQQHIVLLGDPGSGKTTTLQYIAHCFGENIATERLGIQKRLIPVIIRLRDVAEGKENLKQTWVDDWLLDAVSSTIKSEISKIENLIKKWKNSGQLFILFDGLDEASENSHLEIKKKINDFCEKTIDTGIKILVASRKEGFRGMGSNFHEYELHPLSEDIELFTVNWIRGFKKELSNEDVKEKAKDLILKTSTKLGLGQAMKNPLFLRLLIFQFINNSGEISENRSDVIEYYVKEEVWRRATERSPHPPSLDKVLIVLEYVAWQSHIDKDNDYESIIEKIQIEIPNLENPRDILNFVISGMGLINLSKKFVKKQVQFTHLLLREYFVARCLKKSWDIDEYRTWTFLRPLIHHPNWKEPLILLFHMLDEERTTKIILKIWDSYSPYEQILHRDKLLVGEALIDGAIIKIESKRELLSNLLNLLLSEKLSKAWSLQIDEENTTIRLLEKQFVLLDTTEKSHLADLLLRIAEGKRYVTTTSIKGFLSFFRDDFRNERADYRDHDFYYLIWVIKSPIILILKLISFPSIFLRYFREVKKERKVERVYVIEALSALQYLPVNWIDFLISQLSNPDLSIAVAKILGNLAPNDEKIISAFTDYFQKYHYDDPYSHFYTSSLNEIIISLGRYCQRYPRNVNKLINLVNNTETRAQVRDICIRTLCKAAETSIEALEFVLGIREKIKENPDVAYENGIEEGYYKGRDFISIVSKDIVIYLLNSLKTKKNTYFSDEGRILFNIFGVFGSQEYKDDNDLSEDSLQILGGDIGTFDITNKQTRESPIIHCKNISEDGVITYSPEDFTEHIFSAFIYMPISEDKTLLRIIVHWGWKRPDLIVRLIATILQSESYILAREIELALFNHGTLRLGGSVSGELLSFYLLEEEVEIQQALQKYILLLRNPDSVLREKTYQNWFFFAKTLPKESYLNSFSGNIDKIKLSILEDMYRVATWGIWNSYKEEFNWKLFNKNYASILAALANFRGGDLILGVHSVPNNQIIKKIQTALAERAIGILKSPDAIVKNTAESLIKIVKNELPEIPYNDELFSKTTREQESDYKKKYIKEWHPEYDKQLSRRISSAFMLGACAKEDIEIQDFLLSKFDMNKKTEFNTGLFVIIKMIRPTSLKTVKILLDWYSNYSSSYIFGALSGYDNPDIEAVPFLIKSIKKLGEYDKRHVLESLGTVENPNLELIDELLNFLRSYNNNIRSLASIALGKIKYHFGDDKEKWNSKIIQVFDKLIKISTKTPSATVSLGNLAQRIGSLNREIAKNKLSIATNQIYKVLQDISPREFGISSDLGGERLNFENVRYALGQVVGELTIIEAKFVPKDLPINIWSDNKSDISLLQKSTSKSIGWIFKNPLLLFISALYFILSFLIPRLLEDLIPSIKLNWGISALLIVGLMLIYALIDVWLRRKDK